MPAELSNFLVDLEPRSVEARSQVDNSALQFFPALFTLSTCQLFVQLDEESLGTVDKP